MMSPLQTRDFYDAIEWAGTQPWSNGKVGLLGVSYLAIKQWQVAALQPPHLAAMIPWEGMFDHYRDFYRHGGIFSSAFLKLLWDTQIAVNQNGNGASPYRDRFTAERSTGPEFNPQLLSGNLSNVFSAGQQHPLDDAYFKLRTPLADRIVTPFLSAGNWGGLGLHLRGNVTAFTDAASPDKWLELHTDTHFASMYLPDAVALQKRFFDCFLKGEANGFREEPRVLLTIRDPRRPYRRKATAWPLPQTRWQHYYLDATSMSMSTERLGTSSTAAYQAFGECITFLSAPFVTDTEFTGPVAVKLFISSSTADMDIFVTLRAFDSNKTEVVFVGANDPQAPVSQGWLRASQRKIDSVRSTPYRPYHSHDEVAKLQPNKTYEVEVEVWPTSIVCPAGYRLGLTIGGKDFERSRSEGLMKGSGLFLHNDPGDRPDTEFAGVNRIHTGGQHQSHLVLPHIV
jgi:predicted acyl esterase